MVATKNYCEILTSAVTRKKAYSSSFSHRDLWRPKKFVDRSVMQAGSTDKRKAFKRKIVSKLLQHEIGKCGC